MSENTGESRFVALSNPKSSESLIAHARIMPTYGVQGERLRIEAAQYNLEQMIYVCE